MTYFYKKTVPKMLPFSYFGNLSCHFECVFILKCHLVIIIKYKNYFKV